MNLGVENNSKVDTFINLGKYGVVDAKTGKAGDGFGQFILSACGRQDQMFGYCQIGMEEGCQFIDTQRVARRSACSIDQNEFLVLVPGDRLFKLGRCQDNINR